MFVNLLAAVYYVVFFERWWYIPILVVLAGLSALAKAGTDPDSFTALLISETAAGCIFQVVPLVFTLGGYFLIPSMWQLLLLLLMYGLIEWLFEFSSRTVIPDIDLVHPAFLPRLRLVAAVGLAAVWLWGDPVQILATFSENLWESSIWPWLGPLLTYLVAWIVTRLAVHFLMQRVESRRKALVTIISLCSFLIPVTAGIWGVPFSIWRLALTLQITLVLSVLPFSIVSLSFLPTTGPIEVHGWKFLLMPLLDGAVAIGVYRGLASAPDDLVKLGSVMLLLVFASVILSSWLAAKLKWLHFSFIVLFLGLSLVMALTWFTEGKSATFMVFAQLAAAVIVVFLLAYWGARRFSPKLHRPSQLKPGDSTVTVASLLRQTATEFDYHLRSLANSRQCQKDPSAVYWLRLFYTLGHFLLAQDPLLRTAASVSHLRRLGEPSQAIEKLLEAMQVAEADARMHPMLAHLNGLLQSIPMMRSLVGQKLTFDSITSYFKRTMSVAYALEHFDSASYFQLANLYNAFAEVYQIDSESLEYLERYYRARGYLCTAYRLSRMGKNPRKAKKQLELASVEFRSAAEAAGRLEGYDETVLELVSGLVESPSSVCLRVAERISASLKEYEDTIGERYLRQENIEQLKDKFGQELIEGQCLYCPTSETRQVSRCPECARLVCSEHGLSCDGCNRLFCQEHRVGLKHVEAVDKGKTRRYDLCSACYAELRSACSICGRVNFRNCMLTCQQCGAMVCGDCLFPNY